MRLTVLGGGLYYTQYTHITHIFNVQQKFLSNIEIFCQFSQKKVWLKIISIKFWTTNIFKKKVSETDAFFSRKCYQISTNKKIFSRNPKFSRPTYCHSNTTHCSAGEIFKLFFWKKKLYGEFLDVRNFWSRPTVNW